MSPSHTKLSLPEIAALILAGGGLWLILHVGLLGSLFGGLAVYFCTHAIAKRLPDRIDTLLARQVALFLITALLLGATGLASFWIFDFLSGHGSGPGLRALMLRMAEILAEAKQALPVWLTRDWPVSISHLNQWVADFLRDHANTIQTLSQDVLRAMTRIAIGMVLGGLVAIVQLERPQPLGPLAAALAQRVHRFEKVFSQVVSAQIKISALNTIFTAIFLAGILPLAGHSLPFTKTMILITFVAGLIPVLGNLISNTVITIIALSVSIWVAVAALVFLVVIHKVEYFLNARIIGTQIHAKAWELLAAMLLMEAVFGIAGVIAAPVYYAYLKQELQAKGWI